MRNLIDSTEFPFLISFARKYRVIQKELIDFYNNKTFDPNQFAQISTAKKGINNAILWKVIPLYVHLKTPFEICREYRESFPGMDIDRMRHLFERLDRIFKETNKLVRELIDNQDNGIINVIFSCLDPGAKLKLHINDDPYMYRAHLGLIVPKGNIGFKVRNKVVEWHEGKLLVFDPTQPHTAWNLTDHMRAVLLVDFFRPDSNREEMEQLERAHFKQMMKQNPLSFGMSGGYRDLGKDIIQQYAVPDIG